MIRKTKTTTTTTTVLGVLIIMMVMTGCESQNTYSKLREQEKKTISDYISRNGLNIVNELPTVWGEKDYYAVPNYDDFYIHVIDVDSTSGEAQAADEILARYKKYGLGSYSDTTRYWTTDDGGNPITFQLGNTSDTYYCAGWTAAIGVMKYNGHCRIICPSKLGFTTDNSSVTPYGYELKYQRKPF